MGVPEPGDRLQQRRCSPSSIATPATSRLHRQVQQLVTDAVAAQQRPQRAGRATCRRPPRRSPRSGTRSASRSSDCRDSCGSPTRTFVNVRQRARRPDPAGRRDQAGRAQARSSCWCSSSRSRRTRCRRSGPGARRSAGPALTTTHRPDQARRAAGRGDSPRRQGQRRSADPGRSPQSTTALNDFTPELATARPYAVDLTGWFEGFSHPGTIDANGGASRVAATLSVLSADRQRAARARCRSTSRSPR